MKHTLHSSKKKDIMIKYDATASGYDELYKEEQYSKYAAAAEALADALHSCTHSCALCDIGCGTGLLLEYLRETRLATLSHYICIDISGNMLRYAKRRAEQYAAPQADIIQGDAEHIPLRRGACRVAASFTVMDLVEDPHSMLSECRRVSDICIISRLKKAIGKQSHELRIGSYLAETDKDIIFIARRDSHPSNNAGKNP